MFNFFLYIFAERHLQGTYTIKHVKVSPCPEIASVPSDKWCRPHISISSRGIRIPTMPSKDGTGGD